MLIIGYSDFGAGKIDFMRGGNSTRRLLRSVSPLLYSKIIFISSSLVSAEEE